jgi:hypothetical protein
MPLDKIFGTVAKGGLEEWILQPRRLRKIYMLKTKHQRLHMQLWKPQRHISNPTVKSRRRGAQAPKAKPNVMMPAGELVAVLQMGVTNVGVEFPRYNTAAKESGMRRSTMVLDIGASEG